LQTDRPASINYLRKSLNFMGENTF